MVKTSIILFLSAVLCLCSVACHRNVPAPQTPAQNVAYYNGILAESVHSATEVAIALQKSGVLTPDQTLQVLNYCERVAKSSKAVKAIQAKPITWADAQPQIKVILDQVSPPGDVGKWAGLTPEQTQSLTTAINAIEAAVERLIKEVK